MLSLLSLDRVAVIAHRGGSKLRPENTMAAFDLAASISVDGLECDVHLSADREVVVIHDATLDRTTDASGPVAARTAAQLARIDAGARFRDHSGARAVAAAEGVPRLAELLDRHRAMPMVIEIKGGDVETAVRTIGVIREAHAESRVVVAGFNDAVLREARRLAPDIATGASSREARAAAFRAPFGIGPARTGFRAFQVPVRLKGKQVLTPRLVRALRRAEVPVHAWVVDDPDEMRELARWGVTGIITDRPDLAMQAPWR